MINTGRIKHVFPGGNTPKGFFSYYDYILSQEDATRIICIKVDSNHKILILV